MAKKLNKSAEAAKKVDAAELKRIVAEHQRQASMASEASGRAGQAIKTAVERHNLNTKALRVVLGLAKAEETKRQDFLRSLLEYAHKLEFFNSVDAFDDIKDTMQAILADICGEEGEGQAEKPSRRKADPIVSSLVN